MTALAVAQPHAATRAARRPWLAALLTYVVPGLGHLYAGVPARAALVGVFGLVAYPVLTLVMARAPLGPLQAGLPVLLGLGLLLWAAGDAWRAARAAPAVPRALVLAGGAVLGYAAMWGVRAATREYVAEAFVVPGGGMAPALLPGDHLFVVPVRAATIVRGDPVVYRHGGSLHLHRVVGMPGDTVAGVAGHLVRNGRSVPEPYVVLGAPPAGAAAPAAWGPVVVPAGSVFVVGDNRWGSEDSRAFGPVPLDSVVRRPARLYFSREPATGVVRWGRTGLAVGSGAPVA